MISDLVHGVVRGKVEGAFVEAGAHEVKNIGRPITAYRVQTTGPQVADGKQA
jgi:hypothetical protein